jgi:uncharacterized membrane protein (DUF4010 family)
MGSPVFIAASGYLVVFAATGSGLLGDLFGGPVEALDTFGFLGRFGAAAALGLLVGLEREWAKSEDGNLFAGIRTFPSIGILGCACAMVTELHHVQWFFGAGFLAFTGLVSVSYFAHSARKPSLGTTTEITSLLVFVFGGLVFWGHLSVAASLTVFVVLILSMKEPLHELARRMEARDIYATLKFGVISVIILPLLPTEPLSVAGMPFLEVIRPQRIWLIVVLVSGIGLTGYVAAKLLGARKGIALTGLLGGLASSTAVTASMAQRSHEAERLAPQFVLAVVLASTVMFPRTVIEVLLIDRPLAIGIALPMLGAALFGVVVSGYLWMRNEEAKPEDTRFLNPFSLKPAVKFGLLFAAMLVVVRLAEERYGEAGLYVVAAIGGLIDTRPVALSVAELVHLGKIDLGDGIPLVMIAALANTLLKGCYAAALGAPRFRRVILPAYGFLIVGGVLALLGVVFYGDALLQILPLQGQSGVAVQ